MMGSGKSSVGRLLSRRTGWPYHDNDESFGQLFQTTPREMLATRGEVALRTAESSALRLALSSPAPCFVGAAAGTILNEPDRRQLGRAGLVVWLRASPAVLAGRAAGAEHRPWLDEDAEAWMRKTAATRDPLYDSVADLRVGTDGRSAKAVASEVLRRLPEFEPCRQLQTLVR
jgi:shikimate kinase